MCNKYSKEKCSRSGNKEKDVDDDDDGDNIKKHIH